jgi:peptide chain release factor 2
LILFDEYKQRANALYPVIKEISDAFDVERLKDELRALEEKTSDNAFWEDIENSQAVLRQMKQHREKIELVSGLVSRLDELLSLILIAIDEESDELGPEISAELSKLEKDIEKARLSAMLTGEYDASNAIISLHAGAGGTEAQDWALMLFRMYTRWAERRNYSYKVLNMLDGEEAGIKSADILIEGTNAYGYLKGEAGVHRLVRVSPFDASGRRHTSFAAVEVMPEIDDRIEINIREEDLKIDTYRSSGAGGQHVNRTESAVRITHIPTGIVVACQNERSQHQNREVAMRMLRSKLAEIKEREKLEKIEDIKGEQKLIEWGSQIRSYVFMPYTLVKDNRTGCESGNVEAVMDGEIDEFINAYLRANAKGTLNLK